MNHCTANTNPTIIRKNDKQYRANIVSLFLKTPYSIHYVILPDSFISLKTFINIALNLGYD
jgi:hypothetical protein